jgi:Nucleotide modification associated domain 1/Large eukaryotic DNA virus major capsid protein
MDRVAELKSIQEEALELFTRKNKDYGDAFAVYGLIGVLVRIEDKIKRCLSITKNKIEVKDERLEDTLLDLHNYAAMALMELNRHDDNENDNNQSSEAPIPLQDVVVAKLQLNGQDRFSGREGSYFSWVQPFQAHAPIPLKDAIAYNSYRISQVEEALMTKNEKS